MESYKPEQINKKEGYNGNAEKLKNYLELMAEDLENEGIPVTSDCRIDISAFDKTYGEEEIEKDEKEVGRLNKIFAEENRMSVDEWNKKKILQPEEQLEMLTTIVFHKNLDTNFVVVRASEYDDYINKVDNIIIHKKTGKVICAFDEVTNTHKENRHFNSKKDAILEKNNKDGAEIKYGITFENGGEKMNLEKLSHIPIFHLSLSRREIEKELAEFSDENKEEELFKTLSGQIVSQIKEMGGLPFTVSEDLKKRWMEFGKAMQH